MKEEIINGKRVRTHYATSTKISSDGLFVQRSYMDNGVIKTYSPIIKVVDGQRCIQLANLGVVFISQMVVECFCPKKPNDGKQYELVHKDGNLMNDDCANLVWREIVFHTNRNASPKTKLGKLVVHSNGKVYKGGRLCPTRDHLFDADTELFVPLNPQFEYEYKNRYGRIMTDWIGIDEIMDKAGYVLGDSRNFKNPVILHIDGDYKNFDSSNLEWCERTDQRYINYHNRRVDDMNALGDLLNKTGGFPDSKRSKKI